MTSKTVRAPAPGNKASGSALDASAGPSRPNTSFLAKALFDSRARDGDLWLVGEGFELPVHSVILRMSTDYFDTVVRHNATAASLASKARGGRDEVRLDAGVTRETAAAFVRYAYSVGEEGIALSSLSPANISTLMKMTSEYMMHRDVMLSIAEGICATLHLGDDRALCIALELAGQGRTPDDAGFDQVRRSVRAALKRRVRGSLPRTTNACLKRYCEVLEEDPRLEFNDEDEDADAKDSSVNSLVHFLGSGKLEFNANYYMPFEDFVAIYDAYVSSMGLTKMKLIADNINHPLLVRQCKVLNCDTKRYPRDSSTVRTGRWIMGCNLAPGRHGRYQMPAEGHEEPL